MKESTKKAIDWATGLLASADLALTPAGFKYHSERLWAGLTTDNDVILLTIPADGKDPSLRIARNEYLESFLDAKPEKKPPKKKAKST